MFYIVFIECVDLISRETISLFLLLINIEFFTSFLKIKRTILDFKFSISPLNPKGFPILIRMFMH